MAADVARNGFNVTHDLGEESGVHTDYKPDYKHITITYLFPLADALSQLTLENVSVAFRELFLPDGRPPLSGLFMTRQDLAAILDRVAANGISEFYDGNLTQEMVSTVQHTTVTLKPKSL